MGQRNVLSMAREKLVPVTCIDEITMHTMTTCMTHLLWGGLVQFPLPEVPEPVGAHAHLVKAGDVGEV